MEQKITLHNRWDIVVTNIKTGKKKKYKGENIILNQFWTRYISTNSASCLSYIHIGSGTATPSASNTQLGTKWAHYSSANEVVDTSHFVSDGYITRQLSCRIEANTYTGYTIAEVGFAYGTSATNLMTHSLVKDMNGNTVTREINEDEVVDVYGTFYFRIGYRHNNDTFIYYKDHARDESYPISALICSTRSFGYMASSSGFISAKKILPYSIKAEIESSIANPTVSYDAANKKITFNIANITVANNNLAGGIGSLLINGGIQMILPCEGFVQPVIVKEVVGTGDGSNTDFLTSFGFILDNSTAKAFVNDVEVNATFDYNVLHPSAQLHHDFNYLSENTGFIGASNNFNIDDVIHFENPYYATRGIDSMNCKGVIVSVSDNNIDFTDVATRSSTTSGTLTIPVGNKNKRYWKIRCYDSYFMVNYVTSAEHAASKNVHLTTAPANGDTVAVTYQPNVIAKDSSHTLKDMSIVFTFAEYTP